MKRGCAVLALGLGLLAASLGQAGETPEPVLPAPTSVATVSAAPVAAPLGAPCAAPAGGCCGTCRGTCLQRLVGWFTYHALPVPPCCKQCPWCCRGACYCFLPPYAYFLGDSCHEGRYYGSPCCGCGAAGAPYAGVIPPPSPYPGVLANVGPLPVPPPVVGQH